MSEVALGVTRTELIEDSHMQMLRSLLPFNLWAPDLDAETPTASALCEPGLFWSGFAEKSALLGAAVTAI